MSEGRNASDTVALFSLNDKAYHIRVVADAGNLTRGIAGTALPEGQELLTTWRAAIKSARHAGEMSCCVSTSPNRAPPRPFRSFLASPFA